MSTVLIGVEIGSAWRDDPLEGWVVGETRRSSMRRRRSRQRIEPLGWSDTDPREERGERLVTSAVPFSLARCRVPSGFSPSGVTTSGAGAMRGDDNPTRGEARPTAGIDGVEDYSGVLAQEITLLA